MRRYRVWLDKNVVGTQINEKILEFEDMATDDEIAEACKDCLDTMIANDLDTGWDELPEEGT